MTVATLPVDAAMMLFEVGDEALAAARVGVAAVHEAVHERIFDAVYSAAMSQSLKRCSSDECTPPSDTRPMKCTFTPFSLAYSNAAFTSGFCMIELSRQARLIFTRS